MKKITWFLTDDFPDLLRQLNVNTQPIWGKMTAHQMVEHLSLVLQISNGKMASPVIAPEEAVAKGKRHVFQYKNPFPKGLRAPFIAVDPEGTIHETLGESKQMLQAELQDFYDFFDGESQETTTNHPVLGPLTFEEWAFFHTKHISHHFSQFGLMEKEITPH